MIPLLSIVAHLVFGGTLQPLQPRGIAKHEQQVKHLNDIYF